MSAGPYSREAVARTIARLPETGSGEIRILRERAVARNLPDLVTACDAELARRPIDVDGPQAARHAEWARAAAGLDLRRTTAMAFRACKPSPAESLILPFIAANPDATFQALGKVYGKGDLGLAIGHLVYDRYGFFQHLFEKGKDQSSVLIQKRPSPEGIRYTLRPEAEAALRELGVV